MAPQIFTATIGAGVQAHALAKRLIIEAGGVSYEDRDEFWPDGVQDPHRAIAEVDAIVWIYRPHLGAVVLGMTDYNYLYSDSVMQFAVRSKKPILHYTIRGDTETLAPSVMRRIARRHYVQSLAELELHLRDDLHDLMKGQVPFYDPDAPTIFLSYTHSDKPFARQLKTDLLLAGARVWIDEAEIGVGDSLIEKIAQGIDQTDFFAIILSPESVSSPWVKKELEIAMKLQIDGKPIKIMPLLHKSCSLPVFLEGLKYADFSKDYNQAFRELLKPLDLVGITDF